SRGLTLARVHPHIQRAFSSEAHTALCFIERWRTDSQVGNHSVDEINAEILQLFCNARESTAHEGHPVSRPRKARGGSFHGRCIPVECNHATVRALFQNSFCVAPST